MTTLRIMRYALLTGLRDYGAIYTWRSWLGGWFVRALAQVTFFVLIGRLLKDQQAETSFLLIGNATIVAANQGMFALNAVSWERNAGTLPLLAACPTSPTLILASRGLFLIVDGTISALGALFVLSPLFGLTLPWPRVLLVIPLTLLVGASAYFLGTFFGGVLLGYRGFNNIIVNIGIVTVMALCAVNVPLSAYPRPVQFVSECMPITHGLIAIRGVISGNLSDVGGNALLEVAVATCWLGICLLTFDRFVRRGRRVGSLGYST